MIKFTFLTENKTYRKGFLAESGLSIFIEAGNRKILFDMGVSDICFENAAYKKIDIGSTDLAVISHGHYDHTGGIPKFCRINKKAPVYIHKEAFRESYAKHDGKIAETPCSIAVPKEQLEEISDRFILTDDAVKISDDIYISGTIPHADGFVPSDEFYIKKHFRYVRDDMVHEQFLAIRDRDEFGRAVGVYIVSGCSHKGIKPAIEYTKELFPGEDIKGIIAGFHLCHADDEEIAEMVSEIEAESPELIVPVHCTGVLGIASLKKSFGEKCIIANTGDTIKVG